MSEETPVDHRRFVTITFFVGYACRCIAHHGDFEAMLDEVTQVGFDTEISNRTTNVLIETASFAP